MRAKLCVPSGAPLQWSSGEMFLPLQPKLLNTWSSDKVLPWPMSGLTSANFDACDFLAAGAAALAVGVSAALATVAPVTSVAAIAPATPAPATRRATGARSVFLWVRLPAILVLRL